MPKQRRHGQGSIEWITKDGYLWVRGSLRDRGQRFRTDGLGLGKIERASLSKRRREAVEAEIAGRLDRLRATLDQGRRPDIERGRRPVHRQADLWLRAVQPRVEPVTHAKYETAVDQWIRPLPIGRILLAELQSEDVDRWTAEVLARGASTNQARYAYDRLMQLLAASKARFAGLDEVLADRAGKRPHHEARATRAFDAAEIAALLTYLESVREREEEAPFPVFFSASLYAGLRFAEGVALPWGEVHDVEASLTVRWQWDRRAGKPKLPKSEAGIRTVPLVPAAAELLRWHRGAEAARGRDCAADQLVFRIVGRDGRPRQLHLTGAARRLERYCRAAGLGDVTATHVLRHSFGTAAGAAGVPAHLLQGIMGHATPDATRIYTKFIAADARAATDRLAGRLGRSATS